MKQCSRCNELKHIDEFYNDKQKKDGKSPHCKLCESETQRFYKKTHPKRYWARRTLSDHRFNGYEVTLTLEELYEHIKSLECCELCGCKLDWSRYTKDGKNKSNSPSLDRLNNETFISSKNYSVICVQCNLTKGKRTYKEFIKYCKPIILLNRSD